MIDAVRKAEAHFPPPPPGVDMRLPGANRFTPEAVQPYNNEKDQGGWAEYARFEYYHGSGNPDWPEAVMEAELTAVQGEVEKLYADTDSVEEIIASNRSPPSVVLAKGLTQVTMGAPHTIYNGGLCRATVRYFDAQRRRPGLPPGVAALVDQLAHDCVGLQLVNTSAEDSAELIVQAGAFGEHAFTTLASSGGAEAALPGAPKHFAVTLPPSSRLDCVAGLRRFANDPSYAFPWHSRGIPVPFQ